VPYLEGERNKRKKAEIHHRYSIVWEHRKKWQRLALPKKLIICETGHCVRRDIEWASIMITY
jgi:hypothetical protein